MPTIKLHRSDLVFKEELARRKFCSVFLAVVKGNVCAMKVHHGYDPEVPVADIFTYESTAYRRLAAAGLASSGVIPRFYGTIKNINPKCYPIYLERFIKDKFLPTALLLEYIPNLKELHWSNYNEKRLQNFVNGLKKMHDALVLHGDLHPRNLMTVEGEPEKAIWMDFDRAQTYSGPLTSREREFFAWEEEEMQEMFEFMKHDFETNQLDKTLQYYR